MKEHHIDLSAVTTHGKAETRIEDGLLNVWTTHSITPQSFNLRGESYRRHFALVPGKFHLPFRVDMTVMLDFPSLILLIGGGHITFASSCQDNRKIEDIIQPSGKPNQDHKSYNNCMPFGEMVEISITYNFDEMQIKIGGEERFYSRKQAYMKAQNTRELNKEGFDIRIAVSKRSKLIIEALTVTEFTDKASVVRDEIREVQPLPAGGERPKPTFENVISGIPEEFRDEIIKMDNYLKTLRTLKFKRTIDKNGGKITYISSDFGISYAIYVSGAESFHDFGWYIVHNGKPETWHRKADYMEEILLEIQKSNSNLSERIFYALNDCVACYPVSLCKTLYAFNGQKRLACHGRVVLHMCKEDFADAREFFRHLDAFVERKISNGELPKKIFLTEMGQS